MWTSTCVACEAPLKVRMRLPDRIVLLAMGKLNILNTTPPGSVWVCPTCFYILIASPATSEDVRKQYELQDVGPHTLPLPVSV